VMAMTWKSQSDDLLVPLFWVLSVMSAGAACFFLLLYSLSQPRVYANLGMAAYSAPPGTRLVPLPRKSDAPELAELAPEPSSPLNALARAEESAQPKRAVRPQPPSRPRPEARERDQRRFGYAQQWNERYRDWNSQRAWNDSRPWF
jgi:hypothetical protein